jgi:hypothetical protein
MTHKKSFEVIEKYSLEIKTLRNKLASSGTTKPVEKKMTQTDTLDAGDAAHQAIIDNLKSLHKALKLDGGGDTTSIAKMTHDIENHVLTLSREKDQLGDNLKQALEAKTKLEVS